jgi:hypothetical protein
MSLTEQLEQIQKSDAKAQRAEYLAIVEREARGQTQPSDAVMLAELLKALGKTAGDFGKDAKNLRFYFDSLANVAAAEGDPVEAKAAFARVQNAKEKARAQLEAAKKEFDTTSVEFENEWNRGVRVHRAMENLQAAKQACGDLLA